MKLIPNSSIAKCWLDACQHLRDAPGNTDTTVVLHVEHPDSMDDQDVEVARAVDTFLTTHNKYSNHTVAETIFPGYEYVRRGVKGVYEHYPATYDAIKALPEIHRWGTYAHRLLRRVGRDGEKYNPLEDCISKMKQKKPVRASYELGFGFELATYDDDQDRKRRMGGPCLSHLSFKLIKQKVHLTAIYRSHYYIQRAYGNLLGLARLQSFVADQVGGSVGPLVCHSTMAQLDYGSDCSWGKRDVMSLLDKCLDLMSGDGAAEEEDEDE